MIKILALSASATKLLDINGMVCVGGANSTGVQLPGLKYTGDYAVISAVNDQISVHSLRAGKMPVTQTLAAVENLKIEDLTLIAVPVEMADGALATDVLSTVEGLLTSLGQDVALDDRLQDALTQLVKFSHTEMGAVVRRDAQQEFRVVATTNVQSPESWLSESFFQLVVSSRQPQFVFNVIGSPFASNQSLMATGFMSVFAWPLLLRGEVLGAIILGARKPHSGLATDQQHLMQMFVSLMALITSFVVRDQELRRHIRQLEEARGHMDQPLLSSNAEVLRSTDLAAKVAATDLSVMVVGETGVGKEVMARWIHEHSDRSDRPFIAVNCGAIPSELLESVLFGHKKGAFTGAVSDQVGKFQLAHTGTLFLDEVGDLPQPLQVKLLRVLQERVVEPVGAQRAIPVDVRIISATHRDLQEMMNKGEFREDLYYRLAEMQIAIPPLRNRPEDIKLLALEYVAKAVPNKRISDEALVWLMSQSWKGNVRELLSSLKRASILCSGDMIRIEDLSRGRPEAARPVAQVESSSLNLDAARDEFVKRKIMQALSVSGGHRGKAADVLGITQRTLFRYLKDLEIRDDNFVSSH